jgi:PiT family inorganic phosphate transporter
MEGLVGISPSLTLFIATALAFDFLNGFPDSANTVATLIPSRAMGPRRALLLNAVSNFAGPFLFAVAVATTIGHEVVMETAATMTVILAVLLGTIVWNVLTWLLGIPSSSSHALVAGLVGVAAFGYGLEAILLPGLMKVVLTCFSLQLWGCSPGTC